MRLRTFTAPTIKDAMAMVREALGPDAIIISSYERPRGRGAEVRAAVEAKPEPPAPLRRDAPEPLASLALAAGRAPPEVPDETDIAEASAKLKAIAQLARRVDRKGATTPKESNRIARVEAMLTYHGLSSHQVGAIVSTLRKLDTRDATHALTSALDARIVFQPVSEKPRRPVMLIGAPGAGKTVTVSKLAARARLAGHQIHVITTDTLRSGAVEQLGALLARMDAQVETAETPAALSKALARQRGRDAAIFIDTPGTNAFSDGERRDLNAFITAADIEPVYLAAAGGDAAESGEQARIFGELGATRLIMTRLDAARRLGALLTAALEGGLSIAQVSLSPYLSEPLSALNAGMLARILFAQAKGALDAAGDTATSAADTPAERPRHTSFSEHKAS